MNEYIQEDEVADTRMLGRGDVWEGRGGYYHSAVRLVEKMQGHAHQALQDIGVAAVVRSAAPRQPSRNSWSVQAYIDGVHLETLQPQSRCCGGKMTSQDGTVARELECCDQSVLERTREA